MVGSSCCPYSQVVEPRLPYDEFSHQLKNTVISVKVNKNVGRIEKVRPVSPPKNTVRAQCEDGRGNKCRPGCAKVHVIPDEPLPSKLPSEEMFVLHTSRQFLHPDDMRNTLEIEMRTPRNYLPLPLPQQPPTTPQKLPPVDGGKAGNGGKNGKNGKNEKNGKTEKKEGVKKVND